MATFLFDKIIFGPVKSRRLGVSLGINLLPTNIKVCSFDCIYCECGWTPKKYNEKVKLPTRAVVREKLEEKLHEMLVDNELPDVITFAGNGEPTMHPEFAEIIDDTIKLRNEITPKARIAVLSNATMLQKPKVFQALQKIKDNIQKLDSAFEETVQILDCPKGNFNLEQVVKRIGFVLSITVWSIATMLHAAARSVLSFSIFRAILAVGEAGNWPGAVKSNAEWFPQKRKSGGTRHL